MALSILKNCTIDDENDDVEENHSSSKKDQCLRGCKFTKRAQQIVSKSKWGKNIDPTPNCFDNMNTSVECDEDCNGGRNCPNKRIQTGKWKNVETKETQGSGIGLFLMEDVRKGDYIIEYVGKIVHKRPKSIYGMRFTDMNLWINGTKTESPAKFVNHSCVPNCTLEQWAVDGLPRMCFFAIEDIKSGDELTFDYNWELKATSEDMFEKIATECKCEKQKCRRYIERMKMDGNGDDNGLYFAPLCHPRNDGTKKCFNAAHIKICNHKEEQVSLNQLGQYAIFPSRWWHHGYYNITSEFEYYTAQLFCTGAQDGESWAGHTRTRNQSSREGRLTGEGIESFSRDIKDNWDTTYSESLYRPSKAFDGDRIDRATNRHLQDNTFRNIPKMNALVETFERQNRELRVHSIWLIKKTKKNKGFQRWHRDFYLETGAGIITTIVVNVGVYKK
jgi:hypothetical protein